MNNNLPERIKLFNLNRKQSVLQLKYKAMSVDAFSFLRGTCHLFYEDLLKKYPFNSSPPSWISGDLHIENFGSYRGANRLMYFDVNDFDEAILAPVLFEIARLVVSIEVTACELKFIKKERSLIVQQLIQQYRSTLIKNKAVNIEKETAKGLIKKLIDKIDQRKPNSLITSRTDNKASNAKLLICAKLLVIPAAKKKLLAKAFTSWINKSHLKHFKVSDVGFRIAGTGSIGVKRYLFLLENKKRPAVKKLIDIKQAMPSCILKTNIVTNQPVWQNEAERIVTAQELMQHVEPAFLTSFVYKDESFVVKELQPSSDKINLHQSIKEYKQLKNYVTDLGTLMASAQLRSSGRKGAATADELKKFAEDDSWVTPLTNWYIHYAEQVKSDYYIFKKVREEGYFA